MGVSVAARMEWSAITRILHKTYSNPTSPGRVPSSSLGRGEKGRDFDISFFGDFPSSSHRPAASRVVVCRCVDGMGAKADATASVDASVNASFMVAFVTCTLTLTGCNYDILPNTKGSAQIEH